MNDQNLLFRIRHLLVEKFGENKFDLGCLLLAQWISCYNKKWSQHKVQLMCMVSGSNFFEVTENEMNDIVKFFGLQSTTELYTFPENAPSNKTVEA